MKKNVRSDRPRPLEDRIDEEETWPSLNHFFITLVIGAVIGTTIANFAGCLP